MAVLSVIKDGPDALCDPGAGIRAVADEHGHRGIAVPKDTGEAPRDDVAGAVDRDADHHGAAAQTEALTQLEVTHRHER